MRCAGCWLRSALPPRKQPPRLLLGSSPLHRSCLGLGYEPPSVVPIVHLNRLLLVGLLNVLFDLGSLNSSGGFDSGLRQRTFLNIQQSSYLSNCVPRFMQRRLGDLLPQKLLLLIFNKRDNSMFKIHLLGRGFISAILHFLDSVFSFSHRIDHFLQILLLFCQLFLPVIAFTYQRIIFRLILHVTMLNLFENFSIALFKSLHIMHEILFVSLKFLFDSHFYLFCFSPFFLLKTTTL